MTVVYFGARWDSPLLDDALEVGTPVGRPCDGCHEPIRRGDRGITEITGMDGDDPETGQVVHIHAECRLAEIAGHLIGICACQAIPPGHERALQVWTHFYDTDGASLWPQPTTTTR